MLHPHFVTTLSEYTIPIRSMIPWRHNGERSLLTLGTKTYYACFVESMEIILDPESSEDTTTSSSSSFSQSDSIRRVVRFHLEARGAWDLRCPSTSLFQIRKQGKFPIFSPTVRGTWVPTVEGWGHYQGYLELPAEWIEQYAQEGSELRFSFASEGQLNPPFLTLWKFPCSGDTLSEEGNLEELFATTGKTYSRNDDQKVPWEEVFPESMVHNF